MKVRYSFSSRHSRRARDSPKMRKQKGKYPSLAEKIIQESDIVLEVLDARFPEETRNKEVEEKITKKGKILIYILNKSDLTEKKSSELKPGVFVSCRERKNVGKLRDLIKRESGKIKNKRSSDNFSASSGGRAGKISKDNKIIVGVIGYPNTGKSSLINLLIGKSSAGTGADAGFTKGIQKLKLSPGIILLDTPGVIPRKEYSDSEKEKIAMHAIVGGRSYSQVKDPQITIAKLIKEYPRVLENHYKIDAKGDSEIFLEKLGKQKGFLLKGGIVNDDKTARFVLKEWQAGEIRI